MQYECLCAENYVFMSVCMSFCKGYNVGYYKIYKNITIKIDLPLTNIITIITIDAVTFCTDSIIYMAIIYDKNHNFIIIMI